MRMLEMNRLQALQHQTGKRSRGVAKLQFAVQLLLKSVQPIAAASS
jgi:hypothetical protein